jgi:hypothetical protein
LGEKENRTGHLLKGVPPETGRADERAHEGVHTMTAEKGQGAVEANPLLKEPANSRPRFPIVMAGLIPSA